MVVVAGCGSGSSVQPSRVSGFTSGAVLRLARTVTGPRPAPSRPRISETAWYWWVEETWTWVGVPITPERTAAARAACEGINRYCSATWTRPEPPTAAHSSRGVRTAAAAQCTSPRSAASGQNISARQPAPTTAKEVTGAPSPGPVDPAPGAHGRLDAAETRRPAMQIPTREVPGQHVVIE